MCVPEAILEVPEAILNVTEAILDVPEAILCKNENKANSAHLGGAGAWTELGKHGGLAYIH